MRSEQKKMAVLEALRQEAEAVSIKELISKLGDGYVERTVRRWLDQMVKEGLVEKTGKKRSTKYQKAQRSDEAQVSLSSESQWVVEKVKKPVYERKPVAYALDWVEGYQPNKTYYIPEEIRSKLSQAGKRFVQVEPAGTYAHQIFNRLLIDLSYNSSRLEGNTYSLLETKRLLLEGAEVIGKLDEEKVMILNHKEAIRYLVDRAPQLQVSKETIFTLHYLLSDGLVESSYAGKVRDHGVHIGGSTYLPIEDPKALETQLEAIAKKAARIEDPFEQSLFLLIHITYLQAFSDVNKRTARLSSNIPLVRENLVPLSFNDLDRGEYMSAIIAIYELQDVRPILDLYYFSYMRTCKVYDATVKAIGFDEVRVRYRQKRRQLIREIVLKKIVGKPMEKFILEQSAHVTKEDRAAFIEDVYEDLKEMDQNYIIGLGITPNQLESWRKENP